MMEAWIHIVGLQVNNSNLQELLSSATVTQSTPKSFQSSWIYVQLALYEVLPDRELSSGTKAIQHFVKSHG